MDIDNTNIKNQTKENNNTLNPNTTSHVEFHKRNNTIIITLINSREGTNKEERIKLITTIIMSFADIAIIQLYKRDQDI